MAVERMAGRSAPYGQACLSCFKTKCKCIPRSDGNGCERCHRLKRPCHPADALRRRSDKKQNSSDARIAKLEGTLGQLVSMLQTGNVHGDRVDVWSQQQQQQQQSPTQQHQQQQQPPPPIVPYPDMVAERTEGSTMGDSRSAFDDDTDTDAVGGSASWWGLCNANGLSTNGIPVDTPPSSTVSGAFMSPAVSPSSVPPSSASMSVDIFCSRMLHHFPFVHLPAYLAAERLRLDRPFLFRAIVCVTSVSDKEKTASSIELKRVLYETAFLQRSLQHTQERPQQQTVDLLLGLLVYIAWGWEHLRNPNSLSRLMAMAISLAGELRFLDEAVPGISRTINHLEPKGGFDNVYGSTPATTAMTAPTTGAGVTNTQLYLERQRAILGCFVLGSAVSAYFSQVEAPRWIHQMDEGLSAITASANSASAECPSDAALAIQVRLQLLATKAAQVRERAQLPDQPPPDTLSPQSLLYIKSLMGQLQELRASVPPAFQQHFVLLAQTYYTEMCIIETIHIQESTRPPPPTCGPTRISCFWQSALAIKSCTSTFLTLSPSGLLGVSFIQWAQLVRCVATLHQLSTLREPGWDPATVRKLVDLPVLLSSTADKLELAAAAEAGQQPASADGVFMQLARGLRMFQSSYHDRGLLNRQAEAYRAKEARDTAGTRADMDMGTVATTQADTDASAYTGYLMSPTLWLEEFFVDYEDQAIATM
ncbi:hypothetical protein N7517_000506 [Penicillium concentricum]|uniref:Zn(2)-C6 fungal-type domain-containing protein n=1 Tax=Penicillium concentricum TaxID=293559 RepID=A0A9W9SQ68_9EURO|nr:uncharacterized protein N7517_000506 [Penicillium concentricum]KAJ5382595.1 hypothetical protein N7517_000506 [Penicillium concentricum]